jgi:hypothetical protein
LIHPGVGRALIEVSGLLRAMKITIADIFATQRKLNRPHVIPLLIFLIDENIPFDEPILLRECQDQAYEVINGHHRLCAMILAGKLTLGYKEYIVVYSEERRRLMRIGDLMQCYFNHKECLATQN